MKFPLSSIRLSIAALLIFACQPGHASWFGKDKQDLPQWGLDAAKTPTPTYVKDAASVILFDEYLETVDDQGRAVERERRVKRILKPQGRNDVQCLLRRGREDQLLPRVDHCRRPKAVPGPGHGLHRRGRHQRPHHALHS
jgi:hypothetical protein